MKKNYVLVEVHTVHVEEFILLDLDDKCMFFLDNEDFGFYWDHYYEQNDEDDQIEMDKFYKIFDNNDLKKGVNIELNPKYLPEIKEIAVKWLIDGLNEEDDDEIENYYHFLSSGYEKVIVKYFPELKEFFQKIKERIEKEEREYYDNFPLVYKELQIGMTWSGDHMLRICTEPEILKLEITKDYDPNDAYGDGLIEKYEFPEYNNPFDTIDYLEIERKELSLKVIQDFLDKNFKKVDEAMGAVLKHLQNKNINVE